MPKEISDYTEGVLSKAVDLVLVSIYFGFELGISRYGKGKGTDKGAQNTLGELNYQTIKRAFRYLRQKGLVKTLNDKLAAELTNDGEKKVRSIIPDYKEKRAWDNNIYIITYDIPERKSHQRNLLRNTLRSMGCGMLQQSVWITPYNPKRPLKIFAEEHKLKGFIIISSLGKDGAIGELRVGDVLEEIYNLDKLQKKYKKFIIRAGLKKEPDQALTFNYLSILKEDPQLPSDLLPQGWLGDHANEVFKRMLK